MAKAVKKPAAEETVADETRKPSEADSPTEAAETTQPVAEAPEKEVKTPVEEGERSDLKDKPRDARAFQEQRQEIKRLKQELAKKERAKNAFEALRPQIQQRSPLEMPRVEQFMDTEGRIDVVKYENARDQHQQTQMYRSESARSQDKFEMEQTLTRIKHPEIDPDSESYSKDLEVRVADRYGRLLLESMGTGKPEPSLLKVTEDVKRQFGSTKKETSQKAENASIKDQAASVSTAPSSGRARGYEAKSDLETLREETKAGGEKGLDALAERMSKIPDAK